MKNTLIAGRVYRVQPFAADQGLDRLTGSKDGVALTKVSNALPTAHGSSKTNATS